MSHNTLKAHELLNQEAEFDENGSAIFDESELTVSVTDTEENELAERRAVAAGCHAART